MEHANVARIREFYAAMEKQDPTVFFELIHPEVRWHFPGRSWMSGTHESIGAVATLFAQVNARTNHTFVHHLQDAVGNDERVVTIVRAGATIDDDVFEVSALVLYELKDGKVVEVSEHLFDPQALDDFWARHGF